MEYSELIGLKELFNSPKPSTKLLGFRERMEALPFQLGTLQRILKRSAQKY